MSNHVQPSHMTSRQNQVSASVPIYDDEPPPYPLDEMGTIGWSPRVAIINNSAPPNSQLTMPLPMVQYSTMPIPTVYNGSLGDSCPTTVPLPETYALTRRSLSPTTSPINAPRVTPLRNEMPTTTPYSNTTYITSPRTTSRIRMNYQRWTLLVIFGIIALIGILLVITITLVSRKNVNVYRYEPTMDADSQFGRD